MNELKRQFNLRATVFGLAGFLLGLLGNLLATWIGDARRWVLIGFYVVLALVILATLILLLKPRFIRVRWRPPVTLRSELERRDNAHRGLIVFVSLYHTTKLPASSLSPKERIEAATTLDYRRLDLPNSNLALAIESIVSHATRLEHCWLISTTSTTGALAGSRQYTPVLVEYLRREQGLTCEFHGHEDDEHTVILDDDALVATRTYDKIQSIFHEAAKFGLGDADIVADFTGCPRSMTLGLVLAMLDEARDIQFVGTHYDELSKPTGSLFPVLFEFEPFLVES